MRTEAIVFLLMMTVVILSITIFVGFSIFEILEKEKFCESQGGTHVTGLGNNCVIQENGKLVGYDIVKLNDGWGLVD